mmetsp:Transcript_22673/g.63366  ORF Transcript_22673/g.63366 Transcript_22673/m.63366 type:complete len:317 (+) Transcript_22673:942-1892(+)
MLFAAMLPAASSRRPCRRRVLRRPWPPSGSSPARREALWARRNSQAFGRTPTFSGGVCKTRASRCLATSTPPSFRSCSITTTRWRLSPGCVLNAGLRSSWSAIRPCPSSMSECASASLQRTPRHSSQRLRRISRRSGAALASSTRKASKSLCTMRDLPKPTNTLPGFAMHRCRVLEAQSSHKRPRHGRLSLWCPRLCSQAVFKTRCSKLQRQLRTGAQFGWICGSSIHWDMPAVLWKLLARPLKPPWMSMASVLADHVDSTAPPDRIWISRQGSRFFWAWSPRSCTLPVSPRPRASFLHSFSLAIVSSWTRRYISA